MKFKSLIASSLVALMATGAMAKDIEMQAIFPGTLPLLGKPAFDLADKVALITNGSVKFDVKNPGELVEIGRASCRERV